MLVLTQLLLSVVILTVTFLIAVAGFQILHILHDFRQVLQKLNQILSHTQTLSEASAKPITAVNEFFTEVKTLVDHTEEEIIDSTPDRIISPPHPIAKKNRFFHRSGLPLKPS